MATVSLIDTGVQLGRTSGQTVKLSELRNNGYTRTDAGSGYLRVNPYEVQGNHAQDPDEAGSEHRLGDWNGYDHDRLPSGSDLEDGGSGYDEVDIDWSAPAGSTRAPAIIGFKIYIKDTGLATTSTPGETETSTDPTSSPDKTVEVGFGASVIETLQTSAAFATGNWVAVAVVTLFDDSVTKHEDSEGASAKTGETALTGDYEGILAQVYAATPQNLSVSQDTDPNSCSIGADVDISIDFTYEGSSLVTLQEKKDGGAWTTIDSSASSGNLTVTRASDGSSYKYRVKYNDVSPNQWATQAGTITPTCNNP